MEHSDRDFGQIQADISNRCAQQDIEYVDAHQEFEIIEHGFLIQEMKRILLFIMAITFSLAPFAQKHSAQKKPVRKTAVIAKRRLLLLPERRTAEVMRPERHPNQLRQPEPNARRQPIAMPLSEVCRDSALLSGRRSENRSRLCREIRRM